MLTIVEQNRQRAAFLLLLLLCGVLTLTLQSAVGSLSIYSESMELQRLQAHETILHNRLPENVSSWGELGANGTNIRIASVYIAEGMHQLFGISVIHSYWFIDTTSLFLALFLLYFFLKHWLPPHYAALGLVYVGSILPLTYLFALFHPWDRLSLLSWVVLLMLVRSRRILMLSLFLALSVSIKYDVVLLPGLYWMAHVNRKRFVRISLETAALFSISFGVYFMLRAIFPGGFGGGNMAGLVAENLQRMVSLTIYFPPVAYPPLLVFLLPVLLVIFRFPKEDQFLRAGIIYASILICYFFVRSHFEEVRALIPLMLMILPAALLSLQELLDNQRNVNNA